MRCSKKYNKCAKMIEEKFVPVVPERKSRHKGEGKGGKEVRRDEKGREDEE